MVILCAYNFEEFLLAQILFETYRNLVHMNGAYMKKSMDIHAQGRRGKGNNSLENDHSPTLATWTMLKQTTCLKRDQSVHEHFKEDDLKLIET